MGWRLLAWLGGGGGEGTHGRHALVAAGSLRTAWLSDCAGHGPPPSQMPFLSLAAVPWIPLGSAWICCCCRRCCYTARMPKAVRQSPPPKGRHSPRPATARTFRLLMISATHLTEGCCGVAVTAATHARFIESSISGGSEWGRALSASLAHRKPWRRRGRGGGLGGGVWGLGHGSHSLGGTAWPWQQQQQRRRLLAQACGAWASVRGPAEHARAGAALHRHTWLSSMAACLWLHKQVWEGVTRGGYGRPVCRWCGRPPSTLDNGPSSVARPARKPAPARCPIPLPPHAQHVPHRCRIFH